MLCLGARWEGGKVSMTVRASASECKTSSNKGRNTWWGMARKGLGWRRNLGALRQVERRTARGPPGRAASGGQGARFG